MLAMTLSAPGRPLVMTELPMPQPLANEIVLRVLACGVCRTDLHIVDGDLLARYAGIVPGHEVVGRVVAAGAPDSCRSRGRGPRRPAAGERLKKITPGVIFARLIKITPGVIFFCRRL